MLTGNSMKTSTTGAVGLLVPAFVKKTGALIEVSLAGYLRSDRVFVDPVSDSTAVVVRLVREGATLPRDVADSARRAFVRLRADSTVFQIVVLAEGGPPLADATITLARGDSAIATRSTDSTGIKSIASPYVAGDVRVSVQKVGLR